MVRLTVILAVVALAILALVVTELATEIAPGGLVLRSPFVDLASVGRVHYPFLPVRQLLRDRYPLADADHNDAVLLHGQALTTAVTNLAEQVRATS